jgi:hypothetical protein
MLCIFALIHASIVKLFPATAPGRSSAAINAVSDTVVENKASPAARPVIPNQQMISRNKFQTPAELARMINGEKTHFLSECVYHDWRGSARHRGGTRLRRPQYANQQGQKHGAI